MFAPALSSINAAYQHLREVDVLLITSDGKDMWDAAVSAYNLKIDYVEGELEDKIRSLLNDAKDNANEMFRVCAKFNPLFRRPRIKSAIREYQVRRQECMA